MTVWKRNGQTVPGPEAIPNAQDAGIGVATRGNYAKPILLQSMGFLAMPEDVAEHRRRFPDVELQMHQGSAIPVLRSLGQKRKYFKEAGLADIRSF
jgi:hypothetical protein